MKNKLLIFSILSIIVFSILFLIQNNKNKILIQAGNTNIKVNNFTQNPAQILPNNEIIPIRNNDYYILYNNKTNKFSISVFGDNLNQARFDAENFLLNMLSINKNQACNLDVSITVPNKINEKASGKDYNISFCPDGIPFP